MKLVITLDDALGQEVQQLADENEMTLEAAIVRIVASHMREDEEDEVKAKKGKKAKKEETTEGSEAGDDKKD